MTFLQWAGPATGLLGALGMLAQWWVNRRGQGASERQEDERLGHADLVAALEAQRERIDQERRRAELAEQRAIEAEARESECRTRAAKLENQLTNLLWRIEHRFDK